MTQEDIGYELGLIVPDSEKHHFTRVRTGPEPKAGYGTQTSLEEFSLARFLARQPKPLHQRMFRPQRAAELASFIDAALRIDCDIILCFDSQKLFGEGDREHVALIENCDILSEELLLVDPAIGAPKLRRVSIARVCDVLAAHEVSASAGLWVVECADSG